MGPRLTAAERTWLDEPAGHPVYAGGAAELERRRRATPTMRAASAGSSPENGRRSRRPTSETPSSSYGSPACHGARTSSAGTRSPGVSRSASREVVHAGGGASEAAAGGGGGGVRGIARRHSKETARHSEHGDAPQGKDTPWCVRVGGVGSVGGEGGEGGVWNACLTKRPKSRAMCTGACAGTLAVVHWLTVRLTTILRRWKSMFQKRE